jgi:phenylacetate-CoA ligase
MSRIWNPSVESMSREQLEESQGKLLRNQLHYVYGGARFYHKQFDKSGFNPSDIKGIEDLRKVPLTIKSDLEAEMSESGDTYSGRLCVPERELFAVYGPNQHPMSENPLFTGITPFDREEIVHHLARNFMMTDIRPGDTVQSLCWAWEPFNNLYIAANLSNPSVSEVLGIVPVNLEIITIEARRTFSTASLLKPSAIIADTFHMIQYATVCEENGVSPENMGYKKIVLKEGKILSEKETRGVAEQWKADVHNMLAIQDNLLYAEDCSKHNGLHVWEDAFIAEIVDQDTGEPLDEGEAGKLAITNLFAKGCPMIRYLTDVTARIDRTPCECGRTHSRLKPE